MLAKKYRIPIQDWLKERKKINIRKSEFFIIKTAANNLSFSRYGLIISKQVSKAAVRRNRIKRIIFNFIRLNKYHELSGRDILITVLTKSDKLKKEDIEKELKKILTINY
ncbi:MAG: ribonuclease P protein component [Patescibacteria group bacterium]